MKKSAFGVFALIILFTSISVFANESDLDVGSVVLVTKGKGILKSFPFPMTISEFNSDKTQALVEHVHFTGWIGTKNLAAAVPSGCSPAPDSICVGDHVKFYTFGNAYESHAIVRNVFTNGKVYIEGPDSYDIHSIKHLRKE